MQPSYTIQIDRTRSLLHLKFFGFFDEKSRKRFIADRDLAVTKLGCARNQHVTLCDGREGTIMSRESVEDFQRAINDPRYASRRLALVMSSTLAAMQAKRVSNRDDARVFTDEESALAWLFEEQADSADAADRQAAA